MTTIMEESDTGITRLRRIVAQLSGDDGQWFRECLELYQAGARDGLRLDVCLGLVPGRGRTPWWESEACADGDIVAAVGSHTVPHAAQKSGKPP